MTQTNIPVNQFAKDKLRKQILELVKEYSTIEFSPKAFVPGETLVPPSGKLIGAEELQNMVEASLPLPLSATS